jgi:RHS repeat-associated protein
MSWRRQIEGVDGQLIAVQESSFGVTLSLTNLHGDVTAHASPSSTATGPTATYRSDEFGNPQSGAFVRFNYLGGKQRRTELASGVIQMGVRTYVPSVGRFTSTDPVPGGSANAYDYANADPVNNLDLDGRLAGASCDVDRAYIHYRYRRRFVGLAGAYAHCIGNTPIVIRMRVKIKAFRRGRYVSTKVIKGTSVGALFMTRPIYNKRPHRWQIDARVSFTALDPGVFAFASDRRCRRAAKGVTRCHFRWSNLGLNR